MDAHPTVGRRSSRWVPQGRLSEDGGGGVPRNYVATTRERGVIRVGWMLQNGDALFGNCFQSCTNKVSSAGEHKFQKRRKTIYRKWSIESGIPVKRLAKLTPFSMWHGYA